MSKRFHPRSTPRHIHAGGFMLLEALIAIAVLAFGLLSVAGLQAVSMKHQQGSRSLQLAAESIINITERTRTNPGGVRAGAYTYTESYVNAAASARTLDACASTGTCTPEQIAGNDITSWIKSVQTSFPGGAVNLAPNGSGFIGTIMWLDKDNKDESLPSSSTLITAEVCSAGLTSTRWRNCCPATAAAPAGVRCLRNYFLP